MAYVELIPPARLRPAVVCFWNVTPVQVAVPARRVYPDGCFDLVFDLDSNASSALAVGPMTRAIVVSGPARADVFGIRFRPGPASRLFGPLSELRDAAVDASLLFGRGVAELHERLAAVPEAAGRAGLAAAFLERWLAGPATDSPIDRLTLAVAAAAPGARVADLAAWSGLSARQLERVFLRDIGLRPKELLRLVRFRAALARLRGGASRSLTELAYELGYADQAHFTREVRRFAGLTPSAIRRAHQAAAPPESDLFKPWPEDRLNLEA